MSNPERPAQTPDGFPFPYSHFGDTGKRTALLKDIGAGLLIEPKTVINIGSGYDITPSDAFPDARVIHVDIAEEIVRFLRKSGFEAYEPEDIPDDVAADLAISILAPTPKPDLIAVGGVLLTTLGRHRQIPEGMAIRGLVEYSGEEPQVVNGLVGIEELWDSGKDIHLAAFTKVN